jgi:hypothetical protein
MMLPAFIRHSGHLKDESAIGSDDSRMQGTCPLFFAMHTVMPHSGSVHRITRPWSLQNLHICVVSAFVVMIDIV